MNPFRIISDWLDSVREWTAVNRQATAAIREALQLPVVEAIPPAAEEEEQTPRPKRRGA